MRYKGDFPAKTFLLGYPEDFQAFLARAEEMGDYGKLSLRSKGHFLKGKYRELYEFKMPLTRAFGFKQQGDFVVLSAARKADTTKAQIPDYKYALRLRADYIKGPNTNEP